MCGHASVRTDQQRRGVEAEARGVRGRGGDDGGEFLGRPTRDGGAAAVAASVTVGGAYSHDHLANEPDEGIEQKDEHFHLLYSN